MQPAADAPEIYTLEDTRIPQGALAEKDEQWVRERLGQAIERSRESHGMPTSYQINVNWETVNQTDDQGKIEKIFQYLKSNEGTIPLVGNTTQDGYTSRIVAKAVLSAKLYVGHEEELKLLYPKKVINIPNKETSFQTFMSEQSAENLAAHLGLPPLNLTAPDGNVSQPNVNNPPGQSGGISTP